MVNRVGGAIELIGLRAVILDIRQYGNSGRQIEQTNARISKSTEDVRKKSELAAQATSKAIFEQAKSATAAQAAANAARQYALSQAEVATATTAVAAAEAKLAAARANAARARPVDERGRFISRAQAGRNVQAAEAGLGTSQAALAASTASLERNQKAAQAWAKVQGVAARDALAASSLAARASAVQITANERLAASQEKLTAIQAGRGKLLTTTAAVAGGLALAGVGAGALSSASKYEDTLAKINVLTDATDEQTKQLSDKFLELSKTIPKTPNELGASAYFVLSSGIKDVNTALEVTELAAKASAVGLGEAKDVARVVTSTLNAYKGTGLTAAQVTDILVAAVKEGSAEANDFAQSLGRVIPVASNLGVGFDELAATIAALTNAGLDTSEATTGVLGILNQLQKSTPDAEEALESVGLTIEGIRRSIQDKGFVATMQDLAVAFSGNTSAIRPLLPEVRGLNAFVSAFIVQGKNASNILVNIRKEGGITNRAFEEMSKTFSFQKDLLRNQLNVALIQIGTAILPTVNRELQNLIKWINENQTSIKTFVTQGLEVTIETITAVASGIGYLIELLGWLPANEQAIVTAVAAMGAAFAWALPGGPILKGLILMTALLGELNKEGGLGDKAAQKLNDFLGLGTNAKNQLGPDQIRGQLQGGGSIEQAVKALIGPAGGFGEKISEGIIKSLESKGFDTTKGIKEFDRAMDKLNSTTEKTNIEVPKISRNVDELNQKASEADKELQKLAQTFQSTSEAAGQVESLAQKLKLFGDINKDLADRLGLTAIQAGNVQGIDAFIRAMERGDREAFEFAKTLATVAQAFRSSSAVAKTIVLELARSALQASQAAASAILSRPTREVADLGVPLARSQLRETEIARTINPQISPLNKRLQEIDRAMRALDRQQRVAERNRKQQEEARRRQEEARKRQQEQAQRIAEAQLDALKLANLIARQAFERQQEQMQDLIDANRKALSNLEASFLKNNENFQREINKAIGGGDSSTALNLVDQQREAAKRFRQQRTGLQDQNVALEIQKKAAERAERERQRQAELAEALLQQTQKQIKSVEENTEAIDENNDAYEIQKEKLDDQRQAIQDQIDGLNGQKEAQAEQTARIQEQIAVYEAQTNVLKAMVQAADRTLLTQLEQEKLIARLITQIQFESEQVRILSGGYEKMIPEVVEAERQFRLLQDAVRVLTDEGFRNSLIDRGIDPTTKRFEILQLATEELGKTQKKAATDMAQGAANFTDRVDDLMRRAEEIQRRVQNPEYVTPEIRKITKFPTIKTKEFGGFTSKSQSELTLLHPNELVLPLSKPALALELLGASPFGKPGGFGRSGSGGSSSGSLGQALSKVPLSAGSLAAVASHATLPIGIGPGSPAGKGITFAPVFHIQGETVQAMEAMAHRAITDAFRHAGTVASRTGGVTGQSLGPGVRSV